MKLKIYNLLKPLATITQQLMFLPLRADLIYILHYETTCVESQNERIIKVSKSSKNYFRDLPTFSSLSLLKS